jgi:molybdopterin-guanine dinucleotide biosynthesis protein A
MGRPKALLPFQGQPLLCHILDILEPHVTERIVVAAEDQQLPALPKTVHVAMDLYPRRGPLEGLRAGLRAAKSAELFFVSSCDAALLQPEFVREMFHRFEPGDQIVVPRDGKFYHPLAAVYHRDVLPVVEELLRADQLRPFYLFERVATRIIETHDLRHVDPELRSLTNVNTPEDYERLTGEA